MKTFKHIKNFLAAIGSALVGCTERGEILPESTHDEYIDLMTPRMETDAEYATRVHRIREILPEPAECLFCHVPEGDGVCCDCLEIQRQQGRYDELWS